MNRLITGRNHYYAPAAGIVMSVAITGLPSEADLRGAVRKATQKHEIFSNKIVLDKNGDSFCEAMPPRAIELKVRERNGEDDLKQLIEEQQRVPFDFINGELIRFFLFQDKKEEKTELVIIVNHLAGDGMSVIYLIRDIMTALDNPNAEYGRQPLRLMEDFGYPEDSKLKPMVRLFLGRLNSEWNKKKRIFSYEEYLDMFHSYWNGRQLEMIDGTVCASDLQNLIRKCKERKVSLNSVITAVFLFVLKETTIGMPVNVRPENYEGMGNYASGISIKYKWEDKKPFWSNAEAVHKKIYEKLGDNRKKYRVLQFLKGMEPTLIDASSFCTYAGFRNKTAVKTADLFNYSEERKLAMGITNLAKPGIPGTYGRYSIESIEFIPPLIPLNKTVLGVVTIEDRMTISMQYEKADNSRDYCKAFEDALHILKHM